MSWTLSGHKGITFQMAPKQIRREDYNARRWGSLLPWLWWMVDVLPAHSCAVSSSDIFTTARLILGILNYGKYYVRLKVFSL